VQVLINALNTWVASVLYCDTFHADVHAGNLLVMCNGTVAFLDFGIVGRVSGATWKAVEALLGAVATDDYSTIAKALATMKATDEEVCVVHAAAGARSGVPARARVALGGAQQVWSMQVDIPEFAADLERLFLEIRSLDSQVDVTASADLSSVSANVTVDNAQVNRLLLEVVRVGETHGIRFPRWAPSHCTHTVPHMHAFMHFPQCAPSIGTRTVPPAPATERCALPCTRRTMHAEPYPHMVCREFGLLVKQVLYFDRYVRLLAPELQVLQDSRVQLGSDVDKGFRTTLDISPGDRR
jgi:hypothetical protein